MPRSRKLTPNTENDSPDQETPHRVTRNGAGFASCGTESLQPANWLLPSTPLATPVYLKASGRPGPVTVVVGGIHGDEIAGIEAARQLARTKPGRGTMVVIPVANRQAAELAVRTPYFMQDLNRVFPGNPKGSDTERLAAAIMTVLARYRPQVIADLHETGSASDPDWEEKKDTLILGSSRRSAEIALSVLESMPRPAEGERPFSFLSGAPIGSLNHEASLRFGIPVITVETSKRDPIASRIQKQIEVVARIHAAAGNLKP